MVSAVPYDSFVQNPNFADGKTLRPPVQGTVVRGIMPLRYAASPADAVRAGLELTSPVHGNKNALTRGAAVFANYCETCHGPGFCYLVGHGVPPELDAAVMRAAGEFFALPEAEKRALAIANSPHFRGYTVLGGERTKGVSDWREQLDVGPEEPAAVVTRADPPWRRLRGPNQWPASLPAMQPIVLDWMRAMDRVGLAVLRALALGLGQPLEHFDGVVLPRGDPHLNICCVGDPRPDSIGRHREVHRYGNQGVQLRPLLDP